MQCSALIKSTRRCKTYVNVYHCHWHHTCPQFSTICYQFCQCFPLLPMDIRWSIEWNSGIWQVPIYTVSVARYVRRCLKVSPWRQPIWMRSTITTYFSARNVNLLQGTVSDWRNISPRWVWVKKINKSSCRTIQWENMWTLKLVRTVDLSGVSGWLSYMSSSCRNRYQIIVWLCPVLYWLKNKILAEADYDFGVFV